MESTTIYGIITVIVMAYEAIVYKLPVSEGWSLVGKLVAILKFVKDAGLLGIKAVLGEPGAPTSNEVKTTDL